MKHKRLVIAIVIALAVLAPTIVYEIEYVTYTQDPVNTCGWENGKITWSTQVGFTGTQPKKRIKRSDQAIFIAQVSKAGECWYK